MMMIAMAAALMAVPDEPKLRTVYYCSLHVHFDAKTQQSNDLAEPRRFAILMDGLDSLSPIATVDDSKVLEGATIEPFELDKKDGSLLAVVGQKAILIRPFQEQSFQGLEVAIAYRDESAPLQFLGVCSHKQSEITRSAFESQARYIMRSDK
jgi:hypothetical protein